MNDRSGDNIVGDGLCAVPFAMDGIVFSLLAIAKVRRPLSQPMAASVSLRLGHGAALTCHRHVIHYRAAASLPKRGAKRVRCVAVRQSETFAAKRCPL